MKDEKSQDALALKMLANIAGLIACVLFIAFFVYLASK